MDQVLLVNGDERFSKELTGRLTARGYRVTCAGSSSEGVQRVREGSPGLILTDARLPDGDGLPIFEAAGRSDRQTPVVLLSKRLSPELVFSSISRGAYDCLPKPLDDTTLDDLLKRVQIRDDSTIRYLLDRSMDQPEEEDEMVVGRSAGMIEALISAGGASASNATVLINGGERNGERAFGQGHS